MANPAIFCQFVEDSRARNTYVACLVNRGKHSETRRGGGGACSILNIKCGYSAFSLCTLRNEVEHIHITHYRYRGNMQLIALNIHDFKLDQKLRTCSHTNQIG